MVQRLSGSQQRGRNTKRGIYCIYIYSYIGRTSCCAWFSKSLIIKRLGVRKGVRFYKALIMMNLGEKWLNGVAKKQGKSVEVLRELFGSGLKCLDIEVVRCCGGCSRHKILRKRTDSRESLWWMVMIGVDAWNWAGKAVLKRVVPWKEFGDGVEKRHPNNALAFK